MAFGLERFETPKQTFRRQQRAATRKYRRQIDLERQRNVANANKVVQGGTPSPLSDRSFARLAEERAAQGAFPPPGPNPIEKVLSRAFGTVNRRVFEPQELAAGETFENLAAVTPLGVPGQVARLVGAPKPVLKFLPGGGKAPEEAREDTFGNLKASFKAAVGDEKDQADLRDRLKEVGIYDRVVGSFLLDPLNLTPGIGVTKVDDFARGLRWIRRGYRGADGAPEGRMVIRALQDADEVVRPTVGSRVFGKTPDGEELEGIVETAVDRVVTVRDSTGRRLVTDLNQIEKVADDAAEAAPKVLKPTDLEAENTRLWTKAQDAESTADDLDRFAEVRDTLRRTARPVPAPETTPTRKLILYHGTGPEGIIGKFTGAGLTSDRSLAAGFARARTNRGEIGKVYRFEVNSQDVEQAGDQWFLRPRVGKKFKPTTVEALSYGDLSVALGEGLEPGAARVRSYTEAITDARLAKTRVGQIPNPSPILPGKPAETIIEDTRQGFYLDIETAGAEGTRSQELWRGKFRQIGLKVNEEGRIVSGVSPRETGQTLNFFDVASDPDAYDWVDDAQRLATHSYGRFVEEWVDEGIKAGVPLLKKFRKIFRATHKKGQYYIPRVAEEIGGELVLRGPRRGTKQSFSFDRYYELAEDATKNNVKYANPATTIEYFVKNMGTAIAYAKRNRRLSLLGETATQRTSAKFDNAITTAQDTLNSSSKVLSDMRAELRRAYGRKAAVRRPETVQKWQGEIGRLQEAIAGQKPIVTKQRAALSAAKKALQTAVRRSRVPGRGEAVFGPEDLGLTGRVFKAEHRDLIRRGFQPPKMGVVTDSANIAKAINGLFRPIWASLDASYQGLQSLKMSMLHPIAGFKSTGISILSLFDPQVYDGWVVRNNDLISEWIAAKGAFHKTDFAFSGNLFHAIERNPVGRLVLKPFTLGQEAWNRALNVLSIESFKAETGLLKAGGSKLERVRARLFSPFGLKAKPGEDVSESVARVISEATGRLSNLQTAQIGQRTKLAADTLPFAGRYYWAEIQLIGDAFRGGIRGNLARRTLGTFVAGAVGTYALTAYALGQKPNFDPSSTRFMTVRVSGLNVGLGGPLTGFLRLIGNVGKTTARGIEQGKTPDALGLDIANTFAKFARGRSSPAVSLLWDIVSKQTFTGEKVPDPFEHPDDFLKYLSTRMTPFAIQSLIESGPEAAIASGLGLREFPVSKWQIFQETVERQTGRKFEDISKVELDELKRIDDDIRGSWESYEQNQRDRGSPSQKLRDSTEKINNDRDTQLAELANSINYGVPGGAAVYLEQGKTVKNFARGQKDEAANSLGLTFDDRDEPELKDDQLTDDFYEALDPTNYITTLEDGTTNVDWDARQKEIDAIKKQMTPAARKAVENPANFYGDSKVVALELRRRDVEKHLRTWFDEPKYNGLTQAESVEVDQLLDVASQVRDIIAASGVSIDRQEILKYILTAGVADQKIAATAFVSTFKTIGKQVLNTKKDELVMENPDLAVFYPFTWRGLSDEDKEIWQEMHGFRTARSKP